MSLLVRILDGPQAGASCEVRPDQRVILGRGDESDFHVLDSWASRTHCAITSSASGILLEDLHSKNGTRAGGEAIGRVQITPGCVFQIGATTLEVIAHPSAAAAAALVTAGGGRRWLGWLVAACLLGTLAYGGYALFSSRAAVRRATAPGATGQPSAAKPAPRLVAEDGTPVSFTSQPSGAMVFIDDEFRDVTPLHNYLVAPGDHALRVQKAGHVVHRSTLTVGSRQGEPVHTVLKLAQRGILDVRSTPDGASVYLDGELRGKTPLRLDDLEPQTYALRLLKQNFSDWQQDVTVAPDQPTVVNATLGHREIAYYLAKLKDDPHNVSYYTELAHLHLLKKNVDECIGNLDKALEISFFGHDTTKPGPYQRRLVWLHQKIYHNDYFNYGDATFVNHVRDQIDLMLGRVAARHNGDASILKLARSLMKRANREERYAVLLAAMANAKINDPDQLAEAVALLHKAGKTKDAEALLQKAIAQTPKDYRLHVLLGRVHVASHRQGVPGAREKAIQALNAALRHAPDDKTKEKIRKLLGQATR